jgi:hypothetical protein|tara:strand:+ start:521 stop:715 length:195 start_codon:yes stop_codon:yes gene_type:complete
MNRAQSFVLTGSFRQNVSNILKMLKILGLTNFIVEKKIVCPWNIVLPFLIIGGVLFCIGYLAVA